MSDFERHHARNLLQTAIRLGDVQSIERFLAHLERKIGAGNGQNGSRQSVAVERYGGVLESPQAANERIMRTMAPQPTAISPTTVLAPPGEDSWAPTTDIWVPTNREENVEEGRIVSINRGPLAMLAQPRATIPSDRRVPVGVVVEKIGEGWVRVRMAGQAFVQMETDEWRDPDSEEIWLSESSDGVGTEIMPYSARNGIVLVGYRMGPLKNNQVQALIIPAMFPAVWHRVWEYDAWNYIDMEYIGIRGGYRRMVFVVGGVCQAILDERDGWLMRGQITVNPYTSDNQDTPANSRLGQMEYVVSSTLDPDVGAIGFQVPHQTAPNTYTRVAELNENGEMLVGGYATGVCPINAANSADFSGAWYGTNGGNMDLTLDGVQAWMEFERYSTGSDPVNAIWSIARYTEDVLS